MMVREIQVVSEHEADELEAFPGKITERDKTVTTGGDLVDIDPGTTGDGSDKYTSVEHWMGRSEKKRQGVRPPAPPTKMTEDIQEKNYVSKTLKLLSPPLYDEHTNIVSEFDTDVTRKDFEGLQEQKRLNDRILDWMMRWWSDQVNGRFGKNHPPPQSNPNMPRCYFVSTYWYTRMTSDCEFSHENVERWTECVKIIQDYDLMIIPINILTRDHWVLAVIDLIKKTTVIYDSLELNAQRPAHPEIHLHLLTWLTGEHQVREIPFNTQDWTVIRGQQTPQQGTRGHPGLDCGVFILAFAMYLSINRPLEFGQTDMTTLRNWIAQTMMELGTIRLHQCWMSMQR
jgi:Ulp1 family protease